MDLTSGPVALMVFGASLAVWGYTRRPRTTPHVQPAALLRLVWDLTFGLLGLVLFALVALAPRNTKPPRRLSMCDAQDVLAGRTTTRSTGKAKR